MRRNEQEPVYYIGVVSRLLNTHPQTLRMYERFGLIEPQRRGHTRLFSEQDLDRIRRIQHLTQDLGVNLAGVEVVFKLLDEMERMRRGMEDEMHHMRDEMKRELDTMLREFGFGESPGESPGEREPTNGKEEAPGADSEDGDQVTRARIRIPVTEGK